MAEACEHDYELTDTIKLWEIAERAAASQIVFSFMDLVISLIVQYYQALQNHPHV
jgi:hypothetical protein